MPQKLTKQHDRYRHLKMWLAVAASFLVVVGVWMVQLQVSGRQKTSSTWGNSFGQELKNTSQEFSALLQNRPLLITNVAEPSDEQKQQEILQRMKEKIEKPN